MTKGMQVRTSKKGICVIRYILERPGKSTGLNLLNSLINPWDARSAGVMPLSYLEAVNLFHKAILNKMLLSSESCLPASML